MPKTDRPLYGDSATGEIGGVIAFKNDVNWCRIERKRVGAVSRSPGQAAVRDAYLSAKNQWLALTEEERAAWQTSAPNPWTGFNYFMNFYLRGERLWLGVLVFGEDVFNQGNPDGLIETADYENNFPTTADVLPVLTDGQDNFQAWLFNKIKLSLLGIEAYLIQQKTIIERS